MYLYTIKKELHYELVRHIVTVLHTTAWYLIGWEANPSLAEIYNQKTNAEALFDEDLIKTQYYPFSNQGLIFLECFKMGIQNKNFIIVFLFRHIN